MALIFAVASANCLHLSQVKDVLYHLYKTSRGNLQRLMPKEIRILKYLLTIEDPEERMSALNDAFTPGEELEGMDVDNLYTYVFLLRTHDKLFLLLSFIFTSPKGVGGVTPLTCLPISHDKKLVILTGRQSSCILGLVL